MAQLSELEQLLADITKRQQYQAEVIVTQDATIKQLKEQQLSIRHSVAKTQQEHRQNTAKVDRSIKHGEKTEEVVNKFEDRQTKSDKKTRAFGGGSSSGSNGFLHRLAIAMGMGGIRGGGYGALQAGATLSLAESSTKILQKQEKAETNVDEKKSAVDKMLGLLSYLWAGVSKLAKNLPLVGSAFVALEGIKSSKELEERAKARMDFSDTTRFDQRLIGARIYQAQRLGIDEQRMYQAMKGVDNLAGGINLFGGASLNDSQLLTAGMIGNVLGEDIISNILNKGQDPAELEEYMKQLTQRLTDAGYSQQARQLEQSFLGTETYSEIAMKNAMNRGGIKELSKKQAEQESAISETFVNQLVRSTATTTESMYGLQRGIEGTTEAFKSLGELLNNTAMKGLSQAFGWISDSFNFFRSLGDGKNSVVEKTKSLLGFSKSATAKLDDKDLLKDFSDPTKNITSKQKDLITQAGGLSTEQKAIIAKDMYLGGYTPQEARKRAKELDSITGLGDTDFINKGRRDKGSKSMPTSLEQMYNNLLKDEKPAKQPIPNGNTNVGGKPQKTADAGINLNVKVINNFDKNGNMDNRVVTHIG